MKRIVVKETKTDIISSNEIEDKEFIGLTSDAGVRLMMIQRELGVIIVTLKELLIEGEASLFTYKYKAETRKKMADYWLSKPSRYVYTFDTEKELMEWILCG